MDAQQRNIIKRRTAQYTEFRDTRTNAVLRFDHSRIGFKLTSTRYSIDIYVNQQGDIINNNTGYKLLIVNV